ncbi:NADH-quinone oxidoreductase subunit C [Streptomyces sp. uw30]|uniref:NADH-quinone oxidoreductase subunit C n=1 Tax=Streptomyces sp. uw30 TaxID=1828179 RepID=UPI0011CDE681|nr:NADH-quinone oxidoreductase subunit C [Streptomyces sp. uw30]TXS50567.1 NADH-quinone oxidoreductase subunit C [Streptomyces sp. uw30]
MTTIGWLPAPVEDLFGPEATAEESYEVLTVDVPPASWIAALEAARDELGCTYFDWLSAVDEPGTGFRVAAHVAALSPVRRLLVRTTVPHEAPTLPSAVGVYAGAAWHERETHEMFGVVFSDHPALDHLLLPDNFEGHPLRKDFVLAARVVKAWPGAKEPGESEHGGPKRRQMLPPGVPDPNEWGPLKGQLPPAPARPARAAGRAAGDRPARAAGDRPARAAGERPVRRARTAAEGSASQAVPEAGAAEGAAPARRARTAAEGSASQAVPEAGAAEGAAPARRARTAAEGSASQAVPEAGAAEGAAPARRARTAAEGSASQAVPEAGAAEGTTPPSGPRRSRSASQGSASQRTTPDAAAPEAAAPDKSAPESAVPDESAPDTATSEAAPPKAPRSPDAPWHHARPAFDEPEPEPERPSESEPEPESAPAQSAGGEPATTAEPAPDADPADPADRDDSAGGPQ